MKRPLILMLSLGVALASVGCKEKRPERVAASYSSSTQPTERPLPTPARRPQALTVGIEAVPVEEDYEARAAASITEANLRAKLAELEQELRL